MDQYRQVQVVNRGEKKKRRKDEKRMMTGEDKHKEMTRIYGGTNVLKIRINREKENEMYVCI